VVEVYIITFACIALVGKKSKDKLVFYVRACTGIVALSKLISLKQY